jgi:tryptophanyl-tRNA synthetase
MTHFRERKEEVGTLAGLLNYPILQAADVLLYQTDIVPIGEDQLQHLEFTRTLARKFNNRFGKIFKEPRAFIQKESARIMALDNPQKKMSKSAANPNSYISLLDSPFGIRRKIKIAVTDSGKEIHYDEVVKPAISNLMAIYSAFSGSSFAEIEKQYSGKSYAEFKNALSELLVQELAPIQEKYDELSRNKKAFLKILEDGAQKANKVASKTLAEAKKKVGFLFL